MQDRTNSPPGQLSPQAALEDKYTDVLSHFQNMMTSNAEVQEAHEQNTADCENEQGVDQRPILQQLSPVSKFLHSIQPSNIQLVEASKLDPHESDIETQAAVLGQQFAEGAQSEDHTPTDTPKAKQLRPSPPRFTQDGSCGALHESHSQEQFGPQPHIPRELLQQLATQQLRITELEKELAAEKQQTAAQNGSLLSLTARIGTARNISHQEHRPSLGVSLSVQSRYRLSSRLRRDCRKSSAMTSQQRLMLLSRLPR